MLWICYSLHHFSWENIQHIRYSYIWNWYLTVNANENYVVYFTCNLSSFLSPPPHVSLCLSAYNVNPFTMVKWPWALFSSEWSSWFQCAEEINVCHFSMENFRFVFVFTTLLFSATDSNDKESIYLNLPFADRPLYKNCNEDNFTVVLIIRRKKISIHFR